MPTGIAQPKCREGDPLHREQLALQGPVRVRREADGHLAPMRREVLDVLRRRDHQTDDVLQGMAQISARRPHNAQQDARRRKHTSTATENAFTT